MAELLAPLLEELDGDRPVGGYLAEHRAEMAELLAWSRIDDFDRTALNHTLHTDPSLNPGPGHGGTPA
jgi:hypothetical protein